MFFVFVGDHSRTAGRSADRRHWRNSNLGDRGRSGRRNFPSLPHRHRLLVVWVFQTETRPQTTPNAGAIPT